MANTIKLRRGTAAQWTSANSVLADGEPGFETDTNKFKIGNGSDSWNNLPYAAIDPSTASSIYASISYVESTYLPISGSISFDNVTSKPTTLSGYGITDALPVSASTNFLPTSASSNFASNIISINSQTASTYTLTTSDAVKLIEFNNSSSVTITVPLNSSVPLPVGTKIDILQTNAGQVSIAGEAGGFSTWTTQNSNFGSTTIRSVFYGDGLWAAGGRYGSLRTSTDGVTWTTRNSNFGNSTINGISYGDNLWVAVGGGGAGADGQVRTSTDAVTWTTRNAGFSATVWQAARGNGLWVLAGHNGVIRTSTDGINYGTPTSNLGFETIASVAYGNGLWVVGTWSGSMRTSTDGTTWTTINSNFGNTSIFSVAYGNGLWIAGGSTGQLRTSTDGTTWTTQTSNFGNTRINSVAYGNGLWVAGGYTGQLRTSTDGVTWTTQTSNVSTTINSISNGNDLWIAVGYSGQIRTNQFISPPIINSKEGNTKLSGQWSAASLIKRGTDEWVLIGDLSA